MGFGEDAVQALREDIIYVSISGLTGPLSSAGLRPGNSDPFGFGSNPS